MKTFNLGSQNIVFDDEFEILNALRAEVIQASGQSGFSEVLNGMLDKYGAAELGEVIVKEFPDLVNTCLCEGLSPIIIDFLFDQGIYDCDEQTFIQKYFSDYFDFSSQPTFISFSNHYNEIVDQYFKEQQEKEYYRSCRSHWEGGGFGIKGAILGALQARAMNAVTGAFRGVRDSISDAFSARSYKRKRIGLISEAVFRDLEIAFDNCVLGMFLACQCEYAEHKNICITWDLPENQNKARAIFNNAKARASTPELTLKMIAEAIKIAPYNYEIYEYLYQNDICNRAEVNVLAEHLGYSLRPVRLSLFFSKLEALEEEYYGDSGLITETTPSGSIDSVIKAFNTGAYYKHQYAEEIINAGVEYGLYSRTDGIDLLTEPADSEPELSMLNIAFSIDLQGLDDKAYAMILDEKYDSTVHSAFLEELNGLKQLYNCEKYSLPQDQRSKEIIENFTSGAVIDVARKEVFESRTVNVLMQIDAISDDESTSHEEKSHLITEFSRKMEAEYSGEKNDAELKKAITVALAWESLAQKYETTVNDVVLSPGKGIQSLADEIREFLFKAGIIDTKDSYKISDRFSAPYFEHFGVYHYSAYDFCNDMLATLKSMTDYFAAKKLGNDYEVKAKIGAAILSACQNEKSASRLNINRKLDPAFGKRELTYDKTKCWVVNGNAQVLKDDIIYVCYHKVSLLSEVFVCFAGNGIYAYKEPDRETVLYPWNEITGIQSSSLDFTVSLRNGTRKTLEFGGLTWSATKLAEQIWRIVKDAITDQCAEEAVYTPDTRTFLSRRLEHFLSDAEKNEFYIGGYTDDDLISNVYYGCDEITNVEPDPYVALYYTPNYNMSENTDPVNTTTDPFVLITNQNIFFRGAKKIEHLPITNIDTFGLSTDTLWIIEKESKQNYPISFHGYTGSLEDLGAHLYNALLVDFT